MADFGHFSLLMGGGKTSGGKCPPLMLHDVEKTQVLLITKGERMNESKVVEEPRGPHAGTHMREQRF